MKRRTGGLYLGDVEDDTPEPEAVVEDFLAISRAEELAETDLGRAHDERLVGGADGHRQREDAKEEIVGSRDALHLEGLLPGRHPQLEHHDGAEVGRDGHHWDGIRQQRVVVLLYKRYQS